MEKFLKTTLLWLAVIFSILLLFTVFLNIDLYEIFKIKVINKDVLIISSVTLSLLSLYFISRNRELNEKEKAIINTFHANQKRLKLLHLLLQESKQNSFSNEIIESKFKGSRLDEILNLINEIINKLNSEKNDKQKLKTIFFNSSRNIISKIEQLKSDIKNNELSSNIDFIKDVVDGVKKQEVNYDKLSAKIVNLQLNNKDKLLDKEVSDILSLSDSLLTDLEVLKRKIEFSEKNVTNLKNINNQQNEIIKEIEKVMQNDLSV